MRGAAADIGRSPAHLRLGGKHVGAVADDIGRQRGRQVGGHLDLGKSRQGRQRIARRHADQLADHRLLMRQRPGDRRQCAFGRSERGLLGGDIRRADRAELLAPQQQIEHGAIGTDALAGAVDLGPQRRLLDDREHQVRDDGGARGRQFILLHLGRGARRRRLAAARPEQIERIGDGHLRGMQAVRIFVGILQRIGEGLRGVDTLRLIGGIDLRQGRAERSRRLLARLAERGIGGLDIVVRRQRAGDQRIDRGRAETLPPRSRHAGARGEGLARASDRRDRAGNRISRPGRRQRRIRVDIAGAERAAADQSGGGDRGQDTRGHAGSPG